MAFSDKQFKSLVCWIIILLAYPVVPLFAFDRFGKVFGYLLLVLPYMTVVFFMYERIILYDKGLKKRGKIKRRFKKKRGGDGD